MKRKENSLYAFIFCLLLCVAVGVFFDYYFDANDDGMINDILSGRYTGTPNGRNIQMLFPISFVLSILYRVAGFIPWYGVFLCGCQFGCLYLLVERSLSFFESKAQKAVALAAAVCMVLPLFLQKIVFVQYTVTTGLLAATAAFLFYTSDTSGSLKDFLKRNRMCVVLVMTGFLLRSEMLILMFPLICVTGLGKWAAEKPVFTKENAKKYFSLFGILLGGIAFFQIIHMAAYSGNEWRQFTHFFDNRTELYDFLAIPSYEGNEAFYESVGMTESEQMLLENYNFGLDERIDAELLGKVADYAGKLRDEQASPRDIFRKAFQIYRYRTFHETDYPYNLFVLSFYGMVLIAALLNRHFRYLWVLPCMGFVRTGLWMYIEYRGRDPERIVHPLYLMEICILLGFLLVEGREAVLKKGKTGKWLQGAFAGILLLLGAFFLPGTVKETQAEFTGREVQNREWEAFLRYTAENPEHFYFVDVYSTVRYSEKMFQNTYTNVANYDIMGGWVVKSPLTKEKLARFGIFDMQEAILASENVYVVVQAEENKDLPVFKDWISAYYADCGEAINVKERDTIDCDGRNIFIVYEIQRKQ